MYAPHTVTLYNVGEEYLMTFERQINVTVLHGVLLDASKAVNVRESGLEGADSVNLYIPFDVTATDALTGMERTYLDPKEYSEEDNVSAFWTLDTSNCFFAKGELMEVADFQTINQKYDGVYNVTKVDKKDFGSSAMRHFEVGGA